MTAPKKPCPKKKPAPVCTMGVPGCTGHYDAKGRPVKR